MSDDTPFLSRWSRRKLAVERERQEAAQRAAEDTVPTPVPGGDAHDPAVAAAGAAGGVAVPVAAATAPAAAEAGLAAGATAPAATPELPRLESLDGLRSDYRAFMAAEVDPDTRRAALKRLFSDPHFNTMDGLDTYIDDYTEFAPLPPSMRKALAHAQEFLLDSERPPPAVGTVSAATAPAAVDAVPASIDATPSTVDEAHPTVDATDATIDAAPIASPATVGAGAADPPAAPAAVSPAAGAATD